MSVILERSLKLCRGLFLLVSFSDTIADKLMVWVACPCLHGFNTGEMYVQVADGPPTLHQGMSRLFLASFPGLQYEKARLFPLFFFTWWGTCERG